MGAVMTFIIIQFDYSVRQGMYEKLMNVFIASIKHNMPDANIIEKRVQAPPVKSKRCFASNTLKLALWLKEMEKLPEGENICFADCDMLLLKSPEDVFENNFDIAYTVRLRKSPPVNGGIVFAKNTEKARQFMKRWHEINDKMYAEPSFHHHYRQKYAGMNQAAFGWLLEHPKEYTAKLFPVPCKTYNSCNETWHIIDDNTRMIHIKGELRKTCIDGVVRLPSTRAAAERWNKYLALLGETRTIRTGKYTPETNKKRRGNGQVPPPRRKDTMKRSIDLENLSFVIGRQNRKRLYLP